MRCPNMQHAWDMRKSCHVLVENIAGRDNLENLRIDGSIILKQILDYRT
jgi:hypothetical protein